MHSSTITRAYESHNKSQWSNWEPANDFCTFRRLLHLQILVDTYALHRQAAQLRTNIFTNYRAVILELIRHKPLVHTIVELVTRG